MSTSNILADFGFGVVRTRTLSPRWGRVDVVESQVLLAVDGNSLVHRAFHAQAATGFRTAQGQPMWAVRGLVGQLLAAVDRIDPDLVVVGFDDPGYSRRRDQWPQYKATRIDKLDSLVDQLATAVAVIAELGIPVIMPEGLEADDVLASAAALAAAHRWRSVLMTSDRDAFALIDDDTSVLRIINGGVEASPILTPHRLEVMLGIRPDQYRDFAALRGDPSDNLPGVAGIGPKTAARLLVALGSGAAIFADVTTGGTAVAAAVGTGVLRQLAAPTARQRWELNCAVMSPRRDLDLGLPVAIGGRLRPLSADAVRTVFTRLQLPATTPTALRVLAEVECSENAPQIAWRQDETWQPWHDAGGYRQRFGPLPKPPRPVDQPALF
jgi:5'-3' exonuclease